MEWNSIHPASDASLQVSSCNVCQDLLRLSAKPSRQKGSRFLFLCCAFWKLYTSFKTFQVSSKPVYIIPWASRIWPSICAISMALLSTCACSHSASKRSTPNQNPKMQSGAPNLYGDANKVDMIFIQRSAWRSDTTAQQSNNFNQRRKGNLGGQNCSNREHEYIHRPNIVKTYFT